MHRPSTPELESLCVNTLRFLAVDAVENANSGHPGLPLGAAPMAYVLWTRHLRHSPAQPDWFNRDRFVLSAGHGSALLYSLLHLTGYALPLEQLQRFRQWMSATPGHPERGFAPGVEVTTGPLGQGFANGVGMAIAEAWLAARFNRPGHEVIDHRTFALVSDGDLMEGVASEAASLAGHLRLGKLVYLYDDNRIALAGSTDLSFTEDRVMRFRAYGWHVQQVQDGNDLEAIDSAIQSAIGEQERPSLIAVRTVIGYGAPHKEGTFHAHGAPLGEEEVRAARRRLGFPEQPSFHLPQEALSHFREAVRHGKELVRAWEQRRGGWSTDHPELAAEFDQLAGGRLPEGWDRGIPDFAADSKGMATRVASGKVLQVLAGNIPWLLGGSADLNPSTNTALTGLGDFGPPDLPGDFQGAAGGSISRSGRNIHFGVREHAMGAVLNGLAAHGVLPFGGTFLTFSDYMRPAIRLASLMGLGVVYVFTHDSIGLGEDGPTHQPVEQIASLRAIPGLIVIRPCDANETAEAWRVAVETRNHPVALVLTRQAVPTLDRSRLAAASMLRKGAYVIAGAESNPEDLTLIASGSEVALALETRQRLHTNGISTRVVSMPSWELFEQQPREYRDEVLPPSSLRLVIEAGSPMGWHRYAGERGEVLGVDRFGVSAPGPVVLAEFGFDALKLCHKAAELVGRHGRAQ